MKKIILLLFFLITTSVSANKFITLAEEIKVPVPQGWVVMDSTGGYPYTLVNPDQALELLIFKSILESDQIITNKNDLKASVDKVVEDIILTLPEGKLLTNTGYFKENHVSFTLEFSSVDTVDLSEIYHRLEGVIYQHPDGHQLLFSLWGKTIGENKNALNEEVSIIQDGFSYFGPSEPEIFVDNSFDWNILILLGVVILMVLIFVRKKQQLDKVKFSEDSNFWRCECGRQNHKSHPTCHRCGREAPQAD